MARAADASGLNATVVVLAGGRASRLGGLPKPQLAVAGRTLLDHVLAPVPGDVPLIVVGPEQPVARAVRFCREDPPFGGPAAALATALHLVDTPTIGLVGGDMPAAGGLLVDLLRGWSGEEALVPVDGGGRRQMLCSVLEVGAARRALGELGPPAGRSMRDLLALLAVVEVPVDARRAGELVDVDEPADLSALSASMEASRRE